MLASFYDLHTITSRVKIIKAFVEKIDVHPLVDVNDSQTENFTDPLLTTYDGKLSCENVLGKRKRDLYSVISSLGSTLKHIKSGSTGQLFKGTINEGDSSFNYALKVCAYPKSSNYGNYDDIDRPENVEIRMLRLLSYFVLNKKTPHLILPYFTFNTSIKPFIIQKEKNKIKDKMYEKFYNHYKENKFYDCVSILICEWANNGDLLEFIRKNYSTMTTETWRVFFFQILSTLAIIHLKYPSFRHNDLKANNILVQKIKVSGKGTSSYVINGKKYCTPKIEYQLKLWDFDFACIPNVINNKKVGNDWTKKINILPSRNMYYDTHFFFTTLMGFCREEMKYFPKEVVDFMKSVVPDCYITGKFKDKIGLITYKDKKGKIIGNSKGKMIGVCLDGKRLLKDEEFTTPLKIIEKSPFFSCFRKSPGKYYDVSTSKTDTIVGNRAEIKKYLLS